MFWCSVIMLLNITICPAGEQFFLTACVLWTNAMAEEVQQDTETPPDVLPDFIASNVWESYSMSSSRNDFQAIDLGKCRQNKTFNTILERLFKKFEISICHKSFVAIGDIN